MILAIVAVLGLAIGSIMSLWLSRGSYRRPDETSLARPAFVTVVPAFAATAAALLALHPTPLTPAAAVYAAGGLLLAYIDLDVHRLPTPIVLWTGAGVLAALTLAAAFTHSWSILGGSALTALAFGIVFEAMARLTGLGDGDVHLAVVTGLILGAYGPQASLHGILAVFAIGALAALTLLLLGRSRSSHMAFGPPIVLGALLAACL